MAVLTEPERNDGHFRVFRGSLKKNVFSHAVAMLGFIVTHGAVRAFMMFQ